MLNNIKFENLLLSDYALVDNRGKLSLIGIFENLTIPQDQALPILIPSMFITIRYSFEKLSIEQNIKLVVSILTAEGEEITKNESTPTINAGSTNITQVVPFLNVPVPTLQDLLIKISINETNIKEETLKII